MDPFRSLNESMILIGIKKPIADKIEPFLKGGKVSYWFSSFEAYGTCLRAAVPKFLDIPISVDGWDKLLSIANQIASAGCDWVLINPGADPVGGIPVPLVIKFLEQKANA